MNSRSSAPRPHEFRQTVIEAQLALLHEEDAAREKQIQGVIKSVATWADWLLDTWGVWLRVTRSTTYCTNIYLQVHLEAGSWSESKWFVALLDEAPARAICSKILRFVTSRHEELE